jgi:ABC-2 type transport system ATP-binding protein
VNVLEARALTKRYPGIQALTDCNLAIPEGTVTALVGPNSAGKSTLLNLTVGLRKPTSGTIRILGAVPGSQEALRWTGFVAQSAPLYGRMSVSGMLAMARDLNHGWDTAYAARRLADLGISLRARVRGLSGGHHAQLALTIALAKHPRLLVLDEPLATLDPLARHEFLSVLMSVVASDGVSVIFSSHVLAELERISDYLVLLNRSHVQLAGRVDEVLAAHRVLTGPPDALALVGGIPVTSSHVLARVRDVPPGLTAQPAALQELVLAYLAAPTASSFSGPQRRSPLPC